MSIEVVAPLSREHARALAMAWELHQLLGQLNDRPEHGAGSCVEFAWDLMDQVIGYLEPEAWDPPRLSLIKGGKAVQP